MTSFKQKLAAVYSYFKYTVKMLIVFPKPKVLFSILSNFPIWYKYIDPKHNSVDDRQPWLALAALRFLKKILHKEMAVYEWGSGGSSLYWSDHVSKVISVEHDVAWFNKLKKELANNKNITYKLIEPVRDESYDRSLSADPNAYFSHDTDYANYNFRKYVLDVEQYPDESFDIVVVDGRARPSCVYRAINKVKTGGYLLLDNSERAHYQMVIKLLSGESWKRFDFYGPAPYSYDFSVTSFFRKEASTAPLAFH